MAKGRRRWTPDEASGVLVEFEASGLSLSEFSRRRGLHPERLRRWRKRLGSAPSPAIPQLVELVPSRAQRSTRVQVHFQSGLRVEVADVELDTGLGAVLAAVAELSPSPLPPSAKEGAC